VCVLQISKKGVAEKTVGRESGWRGLEGKELLPLVFCAFWREVFRSYWANGPPARRIGADSVWGFQTIFVRSLKILEKSFLFRLQPRIMKSANYCKLSEGLLDRDGSAKRHERHSEGRWKGSVHSSVGAWHISCGWCCRPRHPDRSCSQCVLHSWTGSNHSLLSTVSRSLSGPRNQPSSSVHLAYLKTRSWDRCSLVCVCRQLVMSSLNTMFSITNTTVRFPEHNRPVSRWFVDNALLLNHTKTKAVIFGTSQRLSQVNRSQGVRVAGANVQFADYVKLLGAGLADRNRADFNHWLKSNDFLVKKSCDLNHSCLFTYTLC